MIAQAGHETGVCQLLEDARGGLYLRFLSLDGRELSRSGPLHCDWAAFQDALELFPEHVAFGAFPVDAG